MFAAGLQSNGNRLDQLRDIFPPPPPPPLFYHRSVRFVRFQKFIFYPRGKKKEKKNYPRIAIEKNFPFFFLFFFFLRKGIVRLEMKFCDNL